MASLNDLVPSGVVTGDDLLTLLEHARANGYAIPAVNCTRYVIHCLVVLGVVIFRPFDPPSVDIISVRSWPSKETFGLLRSLFVDTIC
jgi:hypothetical protein